MKNDFLNIAKFQNAFYEIWLCSKNHFLSLEILISILYTVQKKVMFKTKVCTKVGNSLFLALFMIRNWTLFPVKMVNLKNAEMKLNLSWLGFKSKERCLHEL